ncbi:MAG: GNAT family N-acetyltransferase [Bacteroidia bacterium]|jgi:ribosomal-protein-alanine N-acetyltransferase|nr:GNAT family N-acetyltransferase [Bacteroidota bacterium]MBP6512706.1 GNAT family N-acetyltransferase [Bacteroidia bacterium]MBP7245642.1 GNAT family N-acetyltransferase [Bacteroidia bacterium]
MLTPNFNPFPVIETERLLMRRIHVDDIEEIFILRSDPIINKNSLRPLITEKAEAFDFIKKIEDMVNQNEGISWVICEKHVPEKVIGHIGIWRLMKEHYRGEIGYLLHTDFQGKGMMTEALKASIDYGFDQLKLHSIEAHVSPLNQPSLNILERNHFVREGYFKDDFFAKGRFHDSVVYSLISSVDKNWVRD